MSDDNGLLGFFDSEKQKHLDAAQAINDKAKKEGRNKTSEESADVRQHMTQATEYQTRIQAMVDNQALDDSIQSLGRKLATEPANEKPNTAMVRSIGEAFGVSDGYRASLGKDGKVLSGQWTTPDVEVPQRLAFGATTGTILEGDQPSDSLPEAAFLPGVYTPGLRQGPLTLADLFSQGQTELPVVPYQIATTRTPPTGHGVTGEGEAKKIVDFAFDKATVTLEKLTAFLKVSEELYSDYTAIRDYMNGQLPLMVRQDEEYKLSNEIYDVADNSGLAEASDVDGDNGFDAIAAAINAIQSTAFWEPDGVFIHPNDFWKLAVSKSVVSGDYYSGGPYVSPARSPWGVRTVISLMAREGVPIVGAFRQGGQVWRKGGVVVASTNSNEDDFKNDLIAIRAEQRVGLAVYYPEAFKVADISGTS
jgi:hypothetical protein